MASEQVDKRCDLGLQWQRVQYAIQCWRLDLQSDPERAPVNYPELAEHLLSPLSYPRHPPHNPYFAPL